MMVIGLTGGICSGKSTVSNYFRKMGIPIIDADVIAHDLVKPGQSALNTIKEQFGVEFINQAGELDRAFMRQRIFQDPELKKKLEALLHPLIRQEIQQQVSSQKGDYCIVVIPLLAENYKDYGWLDRILVVDVPKNTQIKRLKTRDMHDEAFINQLLAAQASRQERLKIADDVIENTQGIPDLKQKIQALHSIYLNQAKKLNDPPLNS